MSGLVLSGVTVADPETSDCDRPADEVFAYLADAENNPTWQGGMVRCEWRTDPPLRVGSVGSWSRRPR